MANDPILALKKPKEEYWMMRAFYHELSSERITVERVLGMIVRRFGILWRPLEYHFSKRPTIFRILSRLHNMCMDCWMIMNPEGARLGKFTSTDRMEFSNNAHLWKIFDITVGIDDMFEQPTDEAVMQRL
jgi:hypothetical protein